VNLPAHVQAEVQRLADEDARTRLAAKLDGDSALSPTRTNHGSLNHSTDVETLAVKRQGLPLVTRSEGQIERAVA
jgi:hypothetical protein